MRWLLGAIVIVIAVLTGLYFYGDQMRPETRVIEEEARLVDPDDL
ncbi:MAG: hypothetical protein AAGC56_14975 [Pseudomonadota bacterium]